MYGELARFARERRGYVEEVLAEMRAGGRWPPATLPTAAAGEGGWWGWSDGKTALEFLFWAGAVTTATRRGFERVYDLPERVLPKPVLALPTPEPAEAQRELLRHAARALGVATARDLRDYFRLDAADVPARLAELVEAGELVPVTVEGWAQPACLDPGGAPCRAGSTRAPCCRRSIRWSGSARAPSGCSASATGSRSTRPPHKRTHGYYVLPFLLGDRLVARVDLKADRRPAACA